MTMASLRPEAASGLSPALGRPARAVMVINSLAGGGAERQLAALVSGLDRSRFAPEVVVLSGGGEHAETVTAAGVPIVEFPRRGRTDLRFLPQLVAHLRGADLVHAWLSPAVLFGLGAAWMAGVPVRIGSERGSGYARPGRAHQVLFNLESRLLRNAHGVIANSEAGQAFAAERGVDSSEVVLNALPADWPPPGRTRAEVRGELGLREDHVVALTVASLTVKKDHRTWLQSLHLLRRDGTDVVALLAGRGPLEDELRAQVADLQLEDRVIFLGHRTDVADLLCAADLAVLPSCEREGCSNFLMEAMSLAIPVVTTDAGGSAEIVADGVTGSVVPARSVDRLAEAVSDLVTRPPEAERMARQAAAVAAARFALPRLVAETEALYDRWLCRHHPEARSCES